MTPVLYSLGVVACPWSVVEVTQAENRRRDCCCRDGVSRLQCTSVASAMQPLKLA